MFPWEGAIPYTIMFGFFTICGGSVSAIHYWQNGYKKDRFGLDSWDRQLMERDYRLTGVYRGQSDSVQAPENFATNGFRKLEKVSRWW